MPRKASRRVRSSLGTQNQGILRRLVEGSNRLPVIVRTGRPGGYSRPKEGLHRRPEADQTIREDRGVRPHHLEYGIEDRSELNQGNVHIHHLVFTVSAIVPTSPSSRIKLV